MVKSLSIPLTGDRRPLWRVSGRVQNICNSDFTDVTFTIVVRNKNGSEVLDTAELTLKGTLARYSTRGFVEEIQLRIEQQGWQWDITPDRAKTSP